MIPKNFPERKRQRQAVALNNFSLDPKKADNLDYVSFKAAERAVLEERVEIGNRRAVFTKKRRAA